MSADPLKSNADLYEYANDGSTQSVDPSGLRVGATTKQIDKKLKALVADEKLAAAMYRPFADRGGPIEWSISIITPAQAAKLGIKKAYGAVTADHPINAPNPTVFTLIISDKPLTNESLYLALAIELYNANNSRKKAFTPSNIYELDNQANWYGVRVAAKKPGCLSAVKQG